MFLVKAPRLLARLFVGCLVVILAANYWTSAFKHNLRPKRIYNLETLD
jgi:hypothetical protein